MFDRKSDYALNKTEPHAIVFKTAAGAYIRLHREDFSSEEEFQRWKDWSDRDYHMAEKANHLYYDHKTPLCEPLEDKSTETLESKILEKENHLQRHRLYALLIEGLGTCLSKTQRRRLLLYRVGGQAMRQIAKAENVSFQTIARSIHAAEKKVKKFLQKEGDKPLF